MRVVTRGTRPPRRDTHDVARLKREPLLMQLPGGQTIQIGYDGKLATDLMIDVQPPPSPKSKPTRPCPYCKERRAVNHYSAHIRKMHPEKGLVARGGVQTPMKEGLAVTRFTLRLALPLAGLLFVASPAVARVWGDTTIGNFVNLSYVEQAMFLAGALNTVGNIGGIRCSLPVNTRQVHELIMKQVELGQLDQRDNFTVAMARTLFKVGCTTKEPSCPGLCGHILTGDKKAA